MGMRSSEDQALDLLPRPDNDIKAAMQALPQQFRDVVYYADVEGFRYSEIASIMNTPREPSCRGCAAADCDSASCLATVLVVPVIPFPPPGEDVSCVQQVWAGMELSAYEELGPVRS